MCDNIGRLHFFMVSTGRGGQLLRGNVVTVHFTQVSIEESPSSVNEVKLIPDQDIPFLFNFWEETPVASNKVSFAIHLSQLDISNWS